MTVQELRYPIGPVPSDPITEPAEREQAIRSIADTPSLLREAVAGLSDDQLDTRYRDGGWTLRQVVHHLGDSHLNAVARLKIALTEKRPTIRTYEEAAWAELADHKLPVEVSLDFLDALHKRWVTVLESLTDDQFSLELEHPEFGVITVAHLLAIYSWHGPHHIAHITGLKSRMNW